MITPKTVNPFTPAESKLEPEYYVMRVPLFKSVKKKKPVPKSVSIYESPSVVRFYKNDVCLTLFS